MVPVPLRLPRGGAGVDLVLDEERGTPPIQLGFHQDVAKSVAAKRRLQDCGHNLKFLEP